MSDKIDLVKSWFKIANDDILVAQQLMRYEDPVLRSICFHCQQAVEKYIKGFIIYLDGDFSFTHDISRLLSELNVYESDFKLDDILPDQLTTYAVEARYPDPENGISLEKAKDAIFIALEVRRRILQKVII
jgi:HEPN domain-containing protein